MPAFLNTLALAKALGMHGTKWSAILRALRSDGVAFGESLLVIREIKKSKKQSLFVLFFVLLRIIKTWGF